MAIIPVSAATIRLWNQVALEINAIDHALAPGCAGAPGPCASAYALGLVHAAMADACAYIIKPQPYPPALATTPPGPIKRNENEVVGGAAFGFLSKIFTDKEQRTFLENIRGEFLDRGKETDDWKSGLRFANQFVVIWNDGRVKERIDPNAKFYTPNQDECWHNPDPLNSNQGFYGQAWGGKSKYVPKPSAGLEKPIRLLALVSKDFKEAVGELGPPVCGSAEFLRSARQVKKDGRLPATIFTEGPTGDQLLIGTFWAYDGAANIGTPPRLYNQAVDRVIRNRPEIINFPAPLARVLALCHLAMADASVVAWFGKYEYALARPVWWIRNTKTSLRDSCWEPLGSPRSMRQSPHCAPNDVMKTTQAEMMAGTFDPDKFTPNFPAYPSGHATFGGACFEVLRLVLNSDNFGCRLDFHSDELDRKTDDPFTGASRPKDVLRLQTTNELIASNERSRVLLGVHWDFDGIDGSRAGRIVGERTVANRYKVPKQGRGSGLQVKRKSRSVRGRRD